MDDQRQSRPQTQAGELSRADDYTQFDERVWQTWLDKNRKQDKVRFARRVKVLKLGSVILLLIALVWSLAN